MINLSRTIRWGAAAVGIPIAICFAIALTISSVIFGPSILRDIDDANTPDITHQLLQSDTADLRALFGGKLICIFPPEDPALVAVRLYLGHYSSNRFRDLVVANRWTIGALHPDTMRMSIYSVDEDKLHLSTPDAPCGSRLKVRVMRGDPPIAIVENVEIKSLGAKSP